MFQNNYSGILISLTLTFLSLPITKVVSLSSVKAIFVSLGGSKKSEFRCDFGMIIVSLDARIGNFFVFTAI